MLRGHVSGAVRTALFAGPSVRSDQLLSIRAAGFVFGAKDGERAVTPTSPLTSGAIHVAETQLGATGAKGSLVYAIDDFAHRFEVCRLNAALARAGTDRFRYRTAGSGLDTPDSLLR